MNYAEESLKKHYEWQGKIEVICRAPLETRDDLSLAYTPGVAQPCLEIQKDVDKSYELTRRSNLVAVVTDGTAVLGLGDIGPEAGMPVMEGKCALFKAFGDVDAVPLCVRSKEVDDIVNTVRLLAGSFGGVNLEDISAPRCFEIEKKLKECCDIPIFHDDQHGTAVVTLAAMLNALKVVGKKLDEIRVVTSGAGAAGIAIIKLLISMGLKDVVLCDRNGAIYKGRPEGMNPMKDEMAEITNQQMRKGSLEEVIKGADVFIGVSAPGCVTPEMVKSMAPDPILFPMANPTPEIMPEEAKAAGAAVVGTGRSDFPNQINNVLAFPGIFRGALDVRASDINDAMKIAAAKAIASFVTDDKLSADYIIPSALDKSVAQAVAKAVAQAAKDTGVARI
ncbi:MULTISPECIES: NAD(P)-dependent malic enzyme [Ruminococcus]|uniref:Malate dehydrogenase (Oxaloacetate-decarboxylating) n=1 Tax=Ruminococcus flavefaciens TaxID=1265 RepID=A0A315XU27_RUMFL|nr:MULTISPECIES: malic enzyme-like NAD(P)-binding protein [Ruminococcus]MBR1430627.1 NAD-dependent malic enzyme [Ruminococcus sp.]PWJ10378.1 malate dehydrogenase (oxaloacetate-decarboxylating) [Ruminococcus flavefaciens]SSA51827.1 malate dehydrogenase (oxaloacetate-decarboxylating) [Ruminococcus flavefaciens]